MKYIYLLILLVSSNLYALELSVLDFEAGDYGGAECVIETPKGDVLVSSSIRIDGKLMRVNLAKLTRFTKKWSTTEGVSLDFTQKKKKLLEEKRGFSVGKGEVGVLTVSYQGKTVSIKAREACYGAD